MTLVNDQELSLSDAAGAGRGALSPLPGFVGGDALASAVLLAMAPTRMAVYDKLGHAALAKLGIGLVNSQGRYRRFMQIVDDLVRSQPPSDRLWTPRDIDTSLYRLGSSR